MKNLLTGLVIGALSSSAFATTWIVDDDGKADFNNIQAAVDAASDGDEIVVMPGTYTSTQDGHVVNMLGKAVTLRSSDPSDPEVVATTIIDGENTRRGLICNSGEENSTHIQGFTIQNGFSDVGGGGVAILSSSPNFSDCVIKNNNSQNPSQWCFGGGVYIQGGDEIDASTFMNCTISNNTANKGGGLGVYYSGNYYYLNNCIIQDNLANDGGGIYSNNSHGSMINSTVCGNLPNQITASVGGVSDEGGNTVAAICPIPGACCTNDGCVVSEEDDCNTFLGQWLGEGTACQDNPCPNSCPGDVTGDGQVDVSDLLVVIAVWGACP